MFGQFIRFRFLLSIGKRPRSRFISPGSAPGLLHEIWPSVVASRRDPDIHLNPTAAYRRSWQGRRDLNPQPLVLETSALPIELHPCISGYQEATSNIVTR